MGIRIREYMGHGSLATPFVALLILSVAPSIVMADIAPDFSLTDVNKTSATYGEAVSPRDYLDHASAWYFGHST